ncbi:hypothetical protein [Nocardia sp. BMG111209]|uniref:hypothetical protein n=1 Tax=Nocardia sp. BMG111209 TaxID=1160137 RepID=UPI0012DFD596|nr:hypothetical protein [Nocardia sp. BMG111209]
MKKTMMGAVSIGTLAIASTLAFAAGTANAAPDLAATTVQSTVVTPDATAAPIADAQQIPASAELVDDAAPHDPQADFNTALGQGATQFGLATGVGGLVGGVTGAAVGCALGIATGGTLSALVSVGTLTPLGALGGCLLGGSTVGGVGTILGGAAAGIPVGILSIVQGANNLHAQGDL